MGCFNCKEKTNIDEQDPDYVNERSRLLDHDNLKTPIRQISDDGLLSNNGHSITKTDEQAILSRILHKTAQKIIDVTAIEPHSMERSEYMEKMRQYLEKTSRCNLKIPKTKALVSVTHSPVNVLNEDPISSADINLITEFSKSVMASLTEMRIVCKESLVANLGEESTAIAS